MPSLLNILLFGAMVATAFTLVLGFATMFRKGKEERTEQSNRLMRLRVIFQAVALIILAFLLFTSQKGG